MSRAGSPSGGGAGKLTVVRGLAARIALFIEVIAILQ